MICAFNFSEIGDYRHTHCTAWFGEILQTDALRWTYGWTNTLVEIDKEIFSQSYYKSFFDLYFQMRTMQIKG